MAQGDTIITVVGNVVNAPELRFTPSGAAVCNFRIASTPRRFNANSNQWEDGDALFLTCNVWRQAAENVAESLQKGMRIIANGRLVQRSYQTKTGDNRTVYELEVDDIGPALKYATANVTRNPRNDQTSRSYTRNQAQNSPQQGASSQTGAPGNSDPWGQPAATTGPSDEEPPF